VRGHAQLLPHLFTPRVFLPQHSFACGRPRERSVELSALLE
jgi:hypothetical protein